MERLTPSAFTKPQAGTRINYTHPLAKGCVGAWLFNEGTGNTLNDATGRNNGNLALSFGSAPVWSSNKYGKCLKVTDINQFATLAPANRLFSLNAGATVNNFSIVHCFRKTQTTDTDGWAFGVRGVDTAIAQAFGAQIPNAGGDVIWAVGGLDPEINIQNANDATFPSIEFDIWVFTNSWNRGMEIWKNGHRISWGLPKNPTLTLTTNPLVIGDVAFASGTGALAADLGEHNFLYVYDRAITPDEIGTLSRQPFSMFKPLAVSPIVQFGEEGVSSERGRGGISAGGRAGLSNFETASGGILANGIGKASSIWIPIEGSGGIEAAGSAINRRIQIETGSAGAACGGTVETSDSTFAIGGAEASGSATVEYFDSIVVPIDGAGLEIAGSVIPSIIFNPTIAATGILAAGEIEIEAITSARGGAEVGGEVLLFPFNTNNTGSGGAVLGGTGRVNWFIIEKVLSFAVEVSGRAISVRRGRVQNIHIGYAYAMKNNNIVKDNLAASIAPNKVMTPPASITPPHTVSEYRIRHKAKWCYIEDCSDNVLPRITEARQGESMPPQEREDETESTRQIATMTAL